VLKQFLQKPLWMHLLIGFGLLVLLFILFFSSLGMITDHDANEVVPQLQGKTLAEAKQLLAAKGFDVEIQDSIYVDTATKGTVLKQSPEAEMMVKRHRTVYLTIASTIAPLIEMPDLKGYSFRSAELYLQNLGLKLGDTTFRPDIARNAVLEQLYNGKPINAGDKITQGSKIDFVLGSGVGNDVIAVPDLTGLTVAEAKDLLNAMNIGLSNIICVTPVTDTANAFVQKQSPPAFNVLPDGSKQYNTIRAGQLVDMWIALEKPVEIIIDTTQINNQKP